MKNKPLFILLLFFPIFLWAQPSNESLRNHYRYTYYKYKFYGSFDFVRLAGVGFEYRPNSFCAIDVQMGAAYPNGPFSSGISANDYFYMKGGFISFTAKGYVGRNKHFYIGFYNAFHYYGYNKKWAFHGVDYPYYGDSNSDYPPQELRDRRTFSFSLAPCIGGAITVNGVSIEPYLAVGAEFTSDKLTVFEQQQSGNPAYAMYTSFPYHYSTSNAQLNVVCGIKVGLCKKPTTLYSYKYYLKKLQVQTINLHKEIVNLYRYKIISAQQFDNYKEYRANVFGEFRAYLRTSNADTSYLNNATTRSVEAIEKYVDTHLKNKP
jgi:hypothetical protein